MAKFFQAKTANKKPTLTNDLSLVTGFIGYDQNGKQYNLSRGQIASIVGAQTQGQMYTGTTITTTSTPGVVTGKPVWTYLANNSTASVTYSNLNGIVLAANTLNVLQWTGAIWQLATSIVLPAGLSEDEVDNVIANSDLVKNLQYIVDSPLWTSTGGEGFTHAFLNSAFVQGSLRPDSGSGWSIGDLQSTNTKCIACLTYFSVRAGTDINISIASNIDGHNWNIAMVEYDSKKVGIKRQGYTKNPTKFTTGSTTSYVRFAISILLSDGSNPTIAPNDGQYKDSEITISVASTEETHEINGILKDVVDAEIAEKGVTPPGIDTYTQKNYSGNVINLQTKNAYFKNLYSLQNATGGVTEGFAIANEYLFLTYDTVKCIDVFKMSDGSKVATLSMTAISSFHGNNMNFGSEYQTSGDTYPLLYISSEAERLCRVYHIADDLSAITLVQTITFPSTDISGFYTNIFIDAENQQLIIGGYTQNSYQASISNSLVQTRYKLPLLSAGDVTLTSADVLGRNVFGSITATQGAFVKSGKMYQCFGTSAPRYLAVIDTRTSNIYNKIDLADLGIAEEPEGTAYWQNGLVIVGQSRAVYHIKF